ncbi:MAG: hypothetical protein AB7T59_14440 [Hyphomonadaceae bacterium]
MKRYQVLAQMLTVPRPMAVAEAETPAEAVRKAREFAQKGHRDLQIGDTEAEQYYPVDQFAAKHGVR